MKRLSILLLFIILIHSAQGQSKDTAILRKQYTTQKLDGAITLDGTPDEAAWNAVPWGGDFIQNQPNEFQPPHQPTRFKILYDDRFLYIAYDCIDSAPDSIVRRMGRRDEFPGDWVEINIDSYHDLRTAFSFTISVSGVRNDEFVSNDGRNWDASWNPIWYAKTATHKGGWTAEVKIPFSQLRYGNEENKVFGIQLMRRIFRKEERSTWQSIPNSSGVWVSRFGELHGLKGIPFHRQVELAPYMTAQMDKYKKEDGNPFATGKNYKLNAGLDGKVAVTNDLILDFTINPDFGQVEADPSQVRIDGFQNFFQERRPFFVESRNIFEYQLTGSEAGGDYDSDLLFYSRRIGSSPHGFPNTTAGEYVDYPQNTSILGAAKFSGKTRKGWSIGVLEGITQREKATIDKAGARREEVVEPLTSYFVGRLQKDIKSGNTVLGGIFTAVNREKGLESQLHRGAYSGGLDFLHQWKNRTYYLRGNLVFSHVLGTKEAILRTQTAFEHLFQREDAPEVAVDPNRTSLTGMGGTIRFGKQAGKTWGRHGQVLRYETGITTRSPGLELNDIGFMLTTNEINHFTWAGVQYPRQFSIFRYLGYNYNHWLRWDYSGRLMFVAFNTNANANFRNNWQMHTGITWNPYEVSNNALRGTTSVKRAAGIGHSIFIGTDMRKKVFARVNSFNFFGFDNAMEANNAGLQVSIQPIDALRIVLAADYSRYWRRLDQFVNQVDFNGGTRTIVGSVSQKTLRFTGRVNYNITPDLTVQYYGQPFITRPLYSNFSYVSDPLAKDYDARFTPYGPGQISNNNGTFLIDENRDGVPDYQFGTPDFNFVQFRSNLVVRWEYKPGSELYLVWSQGNTPNAYADLETPIHRSLFENAFADQARNIFLIKATYRFLR